MLRVITGRNKRPSSPSYPEFRAPSLLNNIKGTFSVGTWLRYNSILSVLEYVEIRGTFRNEKEKAIGSQTDYRSRLDDITVSYLEGLEISPRPSNKLSLWRLSAGFWSPYRTSTGQHVST